MRFLGHHVSPWFYHSTSVNDNRGFCGVTTISALRANPEFAPMFHISAGMNTTPNDAPRLIAVMSVSSPSAVKYWVESVNFTRMVGSYLSSFEGLVFAGCVGLGEFVELFELQLDFFITEG